MDQLLHADFDAHGSAGDLSALRPGGSSGVQTLVPVQRRGVKGSVASAP